VNYPFDDNVTLDCWCWSDVTYIEVFHYHITCSSENLLITLSVFCHSKQNKYFTVTGTGPKRTKNVPSQFPHHNIIPN